jgi:hypothetical protein
MTVREMTPNDWDPDISELIRNYAIRLLIINVVIKNDIFIIIAQSTTLKSKSIPYSLMVYSCNEYTISRFGNKIIRDFFQFLYIYIILQSPRVRKVTLNFYYTYITLK